MAKEYVLKRSPFDKNRLLKMGKEMLSEASSDRNHALECYQYFKDMVEESGGTDNTAKNLMVDCLKLAQNSRNSTTKLFAMMSKLLEVEANGGEGSAEGISLEELEKLIK